MLLTLPNSSEIDIFVNNTADCAVLQNLSVNMSHDIVAPALLLESSGSELVVLHALVGLQLRSGLPEMSRRSSRSDSARQTQICLQVLKRSRGE